MKLTLESLYRDHDGLRRILYLLEELLISIYRGSSQNYPLLRRILAYIQDHPERVHHPAEDAVFSVMFKNGVNDRKFRDDVNTLMKDHSEIENIIRETIEAVDTMLVNPHPDVADIGDRLSTLINRQRAHLLFEEMNVYPQLAEHLGKKDWKNIATLVPDHEDPLFGGEVKKEYELIFKAF
ncbi:MAG TPA: hypothetical protein DDW55_08560 [Gammaproteobacteria bacterium]|nr:hypothetical protein [Gammaproteobacteria bacterium]